MTKPDAASFATGSSHPDYPGTSPQQQNRWTARPDGKGNEHLPPQYGADGEPPSEDGLAALGYEPELIRSRSTAQVAFMSFVLSSVPYGLATTLIYPLTGGGPVTIIWGWLTVCAIILCLSVSLGEITSVYPTAGGVYYQTFMLSPPWCRRILAWICGWSFVLGNMTITLSVNFGTTLLFIGCVNIFQNSEGQGIFAAEPYQIWLVFLGITLICNLVSALMNRWLPLLDTIAIGWTFVGVTAVVVCVLAIAHDGRHSAEYVFTDFTPQSGWPDGWAYCVGLLHAAYATSASGMITSMCEEVRRPEVQVPRAMVITIILNFICGMIFLIPLVFVLPDIQSILNDPSGQPFPVILRSAIGHEGGAFALCVPIIVLGILCGIGCTTAASRATWAFARDSGMPGSKWWKLVDRRLDVPLNSMMLSMVVQLALGLIYFGSQAAYNAFSGAGVIFLTLSYVIPVAVSFAMKRRAISAGSFNMGTTGAICNVISIAWCLLAIPLFSMPSTIPVSSSTMNYASAVFFGGIVVSVLYYFLHGRRHYVGPPAEGGPEAVLERRRSVRSIDQHLRPHGISQAKARASSDAGGD